MRLTIERMRTMVLLAGILLVAALVTFLAVGKWKHALNRRDLPKRLGIDIQQEANGFTHGEFRAGHALFKITASKEEQLSGDRYRLHSVRIEMYGADGSTDSIEGSEFEYDRQSGIAHAQGPVEITLTRPPNVARKAKPGSVLGNNRANTGGNPPAQAGKIRVKTSGLSFDQRSGVASTEQPVEFALAQASGSAVGATYDSQGGNLVLQRAVQLNAVRGVDPVKLTAQHA